MKTHLFSLFRQRLHTVSFAVCVTGILAIASCDINDTPNLTQPTQEFYHLHGMEAFINHNSSPIRESFNAVRGSVGKRGSGSKTIWNRKNKWGIGLYVSANHVYNISGWPSRNAQWFDNSKESLGIFETSQIPSPDGDLLPGEILSADFPLLHSDISPQASNSTILPGQDFYLGIIDNQKVLAKPLPQYPDHPILSVPLELFDPELRTLAEKTWENPEPGQEVLGIGFPQDVTLFPKGAVAHGKVLSDSEALQAINLLKQVGDEEGDLPYQPELEFFIDAQALPGMSGGGVFNLDGQFLGIMVRASTKMEAPKIIRVVKTSYMRTEILDYLSTLPTGEREQLLQFLGQEFEE